MSVVSRGAALLLGAAMMTTSLAGQTSSGAQAEVRAVVKDFFDALGQGDAARLAAAMDSATRFTLLRPGPGGSRVLVLTGRQFLENVTQPGGQRFEELIRNPEIRIDGDLATVWTEYQVLVGGKLSHCGTDALQLGRLGGSWKLLSVSDSFRQQGCGAPWK